MPVWRGQQVPPHHPELHDPGLLDLTGPRVRPLRVLGFEGFRVLGFRVLGF